MITLYIVRSRLGSVNVQGEGSQKSGTEESASILHSVQVAVWDNLFFMRT